MTNNDNQHIFASLDLGSNSFHMLVAEHIDGQLVIVDKMKEMVRLAGGLDKQQMLTEEAMENGIACLEKFGQRLREIPAGNIRAVGTNTLRRARNSSLFLRSALQSLGHPIHIISGREEARLIYVGVANTVFNDKDKRIVIDIGGGSTEIIIGKGFEPLLTESLYMGCVSITQKFFADGAISKKSFQKAIMFARQELETVQENYQNEGWDIAIGTSGTISAIQKIIVDSGWSSNDFISDASLGLLRDKLIESGHIENIDLPGLSSKRVPVIAGGIAILIACFEALKIEAITPCQGALREGLLYDLIGRNEDRDIRYQSVSLLAEQFKADSSNNDKIATTANLIFSELRKSWGLKKSHSHMINWACSLHNIGLGIAHSQFHKHGAYIVANSEMAGFSQQEQAQLASLVRFHRRKLNLEELCLHSQEDADKMIYLCTIIRLSVLLHRGRLQDALPEIKFKSDDKKLTLKFPDDWLAEHPLTEADLLTETSYLKNIGVELNIS